MVDEFKEFKGSTNIYYEDSKGVEHKLRSGASSKIMLNIRNIITISEAFKNNGTIFKSKCLINYDDKNILLNHDYKSVKKIKENYLKNNSRIKIKGFKK